MRPARPVGERPRAHRGRHLGMLRVGVGEEPSNQANPSRTRPRASQSGCSDDASVNARLDIGVFAAPRERRAQIVDLDSACSIRRS